MISSIIRHMKKLFLLPLLFLSFAQAETIQCKVVSVTDGDTITCLTDQKEQIKVRLYQIDAPESGQNYGQKAKQALSDMIFNRNVQINTVGKDKYKRTLGVVTFLEAGSCNMPPPTSGGTCLLPYDANLKMVKQGYAWYDPFNTNNPQYQQAEQEAREAGRGLWADKDPIPPWEWRIHNRNLKK